MLANLEKSLSVIKNIDDHLLRISKQPKSLYALRQQALDSLAKVGFPTIKDEEWKYTNISPILKNQYQIADSASKPDLERLNHYTSPDDINIFFINGVFSPELSSKEALPKGLTLSSLRDASSTVNTDIAARFKTSTIEGESAFVLLNKALYQDGIYIKTAPQTVVEKLIHIIHITDQPQIIAIPRNLFDIGQSSELKILESYISFSDSLVYWVNSLTDIFLAENASCKYFQAQSESLESFHLGAIRVWQERDSNFFGFNFSTGAMIARNNLDIVLKGEGGNALLKGLYCVRLNQHVDNHTAVDHQFPNCTSNQLYKGILNQDSRAVFNGKIFVRPIAQKTNSYQLNKNLLLGKGCRVDTKPQLEIDADDVKCTHGATIGQLNNDELFYLQTRSIPKKTAVKMLSRGFADDILQQIEDDRIYQKLNILLEPTFSAL